MLFTSEQLRDLMGNISILRYIGEYGSNGILPMSSIFSLSVARYRQAAERLADWIQFRQNIGIQPGYFNPEDLQKVIDSVVREVPFEEEVANYEYFASRKYPNSYLAILERRLQVRRDLELELDIDMHFPEEAEHGEANNEEAKHEEEVEDHAVLIDPEILENIALLRRRIGVPRTFINQQQPSVFD